MKALIALSLFLLPAIACAQTSQSAFTASACGPQMIDTARKNTHVMQAACVGQLRNPAVQNPEPAPAVEFTLSDDSTHAFRVASSETLAFAEGSARALTIYELVNESGEHATMKAIVNADGSVKSISGEFQTNPYFVPVFQKVETP